MIDGNEVVNLTNNIIEINKAKDINKKSPIKSPKI